MIEGCVEKDWGSLGPSGDNIMFEQQCLLWVELGSAGPSFLDLAAHF